MYLDSSEQDLQDVAVGFLSRGSFGTPADSKSFLGIKPVGGAAPEFSFWLVSVCGFGTGKQMSAGGAELVLRIGFGGEVLWREPGFNPARPRSVRATMQAGAQTDWVVKHEIKV